MSDQPRHGKTQPVQFASTDNGIRLPVIDVTHPAFALADDAPAVAAIRKAFITEVQQRKPSRLPAVLRKPLIALALRRSPLTRSLMLPSGSDFLDGLSTYAIKLGSENLVRPFNSRYDRQLAASPFAQSLRVRLSQLARLAAEALTPALEARSDAPLHFINIAGGPAADSLNALIVLNKSRPELLARQIGIHVLDRDSSGPAFGKNALTVLTSTEGPLAGLDVDFDIRVYDWNDVSPLTALIDALSRRNAIIAAASEGGLFEYGDDAVIVGNLRALAANGRGAEFVFGSVFRNDAISKGIAARSAFSIVPRGLEVFAELAGKAGFAVTRSMDSLTSDQVVLEPTR